MGIEKTTQPQRLTHENTVIGSDNVPFNTDIALSVYGKIKSSDQITGASLSTYNGGLTLNNGDINLNSGNITNAGSVTVNNGLTVNNGGLTVSNGGLTVSNGGLTVQSGNINVTNGTVEATSVNATNITVTGSITSTNNTPFISPQDLLPGTGAEDGSLLRYDGATGKWQPYKIYSVGLGKTHTSFDPNNPNTNDGSSTFYAKVSSVAKLSAFNSFGSVFNPVTITGVTPWKKMNPMPIAARGNLNHPAWAAGGIMDQPVLYRKMYMSTTGVLSWNYSGTATKERSNFSPTISIQGVRADGTIRGRLGNVRVTATNVVTGYQGGNADPNTGMVTGGTIVTVQDGAIAERQQCPASNTNYVIVSNDRTTSTFANGPQDQDVSILSANDFRQLHPECGDNQHTGNWSEPLSEAQFRYSAPWYSLITFMNHAPSIRFGTSFVLEMNYESSFTWPNDTIFKNNGTIIHKFSYDLKAFRYGELPISLTTRGQLFVYDDVFNPNVSYNIVLYPPKQMPTDAREDQNDVVSRIYEGAFSVTY